jgi:hypothetical protein
LWRAPGYFSRARRELDLIVAFIEAYNARDIDAALDLCART